VRTGGDFYSDDFHAFRLQGHDMHLHRKGGAGSVGDERLQADWVGHAPVSWACACRLSAIFHTNQYPTALGAGSVCQAHNGMNDLLIAEFSLLFALELHIQAFALLDEGA
jgi:hypothetical protein